MSLLNILPSVHDSRLGMARPFCIWCLPMTDNCDLCVEVRDQDLVVTMPGTSLRVVYRKPHRGSQLVARLDYFQDQQKGPITRAEFLAKALKLANDKACELAGLRKLSPAECPQPQIAEPTSTMATIINTVVIVRSG